jgi:phosphoglycolate phosphatase
MTVPVRGLIYDCDGVLFESKSANLAYYNAVLHHFGEPPVPGGDEEKCLLCHTAASPRVLEVLLGSDRLDAALEFAAALDYRQFIPFMSPEPDMIEALEILAGKIPLAVATNRGYSVLAILEHFGLDRFFRVVVTSRDVIFPKPAPDMLLLTAQRLELNTKDLLFLGDSELDRQAACAAGIRFAGYKGAAGEGDIAVAGHKQIVEILEGGTISVERREVKGF